MFYINRLIIFKLKKKKKEERWPSVKLLIVDSYISLFFSIIIMTANVVIKYLIKERENEVNLI